MEETMTQFRFRPPVITILMASVALGLTASFASAQESSPFAGEDLGPQAARELSYPDPVYEEPAAELAVAPPATRAFGAAEAFLRSTANQLQAMLPPDITLQTDEAAASALTIGALEEEEPVPLGVPEGIDPEQARELQEEVDREQVRELGEGPRSRVEKWILHYPVAIQGVPVSNRSDVVAFVGSGGEIQNVRKRNLPTSINATEPTVSPEAAVEAAIADAGEWAEDATIDGPELEAFTNPDLSSELTYRVDLTSTNFSDPAARRYWISAVEEPSVVHWESLVHHNHNGQVTGNIWTESGRADRPSANQPFDKTTTRRIGAGGGAAQTNEHGLYGYTSGSGNATIEIDLSDAHECSSIQNMAGSVLSASGNGDTSGPIDLHFGPTGLEETAQTSGFYFTNEACRLAKDILDPTDLPALPTRVNVSGQCNAFWNGSSINFFQAGGSCPNMAYSDVVYHEYGHGVDARKGGILDGGYSEGFGDAMAILGTRQSCVGRDFFGAGTCLREASDVVLWPPAPGDGVHAQGRRFAGFTHELIEQLKNTYSEDGAYAIATQLVMASAKANPADIPDAVKLAFIADDDDGDLTNGTPHFTQLAAAADSRNIPRPADPIAGVRRMGFAWAHHPTAPSYTPSATYAYNSSGGPITATRTGTGQYAMTFTGLGGQGRAGGNVQVTAYGPSSDTCKVYWWSSGGSDFRANVRCFTPNGRLVNTRYTILVTWP
jgi:hypothetical protein